MSAIARVKSMLIAGRQDEYQSHASRKCPWLDQQCKDSSAQIRFAREALLLGL